MIRTLVTMVVFSVAAPVAVVSAAGQQQLTPEQTKFFETKIRPVLIKECYGCHSSKSGNVKGGLRLDNQRLMQLGGDSGPGVVANDLDESLIYNAMTHTDWVMPPKRKLSDAVINDFRVWIEMGAPDPRVSEVAEIKSTISKEDIADAKENFWAFKKPTLPAVPSVSDTAWPKTDIDRFVLSKLEQSSLTPSDDALSFQVLRRLCFDLVGLPPNPEQIEYFQARWKQDPDKAITLVVNRLLEKDQFGERWGRHWLDVARYAESTGREVNMTYPHAWRFRDYVIDSFNADKPFNQFVQEQIAGDLLPVKTDEQWQENLIATGFLAMGTKNVNENDGRQFDADLVDEQLDTTTRVFLGTSVACARCHDHKFDAIPQTDYYALAGIFGSSKTYFGNPPSKFGSLGDLQTKRKSSLILLPVPESDAIGTKLTRQQIQEMESEVSEIRSQLAASRRERQSGASQSKNDITSLARLTTKAAQLSAKLATVDENGNPRSYCMGVQESDSPTNARLMVRGDIDEPGQLVQRGFPQVLTDKKLVVPNRKSGRLELARFIGSTENPLTARVMVNRIWQHMIGQGIVTTTENFGVTGAAPSNQELLDYLAVKFVQSGWSVKSVIREIAKSRVYRISSQYDDRKFQYDPENLLVWRANSRRLDAEAIRDAMLMASGQIEFDRPHGSDVAKAGYVRVRSGRLDSARDAAANARQELQQRMRQGGGNQRGGFQRGATRGTMRGGGRGRSNDRDAIQSAREQLATLISKKPLDVEDAKYRSVYMPIVRDEVPRSLYVFDFAESSLVVGTREQSNSPNQSLYLMNNPFVLSQSEAFAKRLMNDSPTNAARINDAFVIAYGRKPTSAERTATARFISNFGSSGEQTLAAFCQSLFASAEFRYVD